ncbi:hypothetical protein BDR05DRAFT_1003141 [Suillus weaverae]|nr:hypothetical protein BDR05DRAFT_1003141 [Suillus weaverae]
MEDDMSQPPNMSANMVPPIILSEMGQMDIEETLDDVTSQPATSTVRIDKRERLDVQQKQVINKPSDKCRIKEVDYSETLHETIYSQEEWINTMSREIQMAEKESELARMEQQFARHQRVQGDDIEMESNPPLWSGTGQPSIPSAKLSSGTACLEAIKRIKRTRGVSRRTRLVSVAVAEDTEEVPHEQSSEQDVPPHEQHTPSPCAISMEDVVARGVEAALRRVLVNQEFPGVKKCSPRRRKTEEEEIRQEKVGESSDKRDFLLGEVRCLFKDAFSISQDADFIAHEAASQEDVYSYEYEDGPGPDLNTLAFDPKNGSKTPWNSKIIDLLLGELQRRGVAEGWPFCRSLQAPVYCLDGWQSKITAKGAPETPVEVEVRLIVKKDQTLKVTHQTTCRKNKYLRRLMVLNNLVKQKTDNQEDDPPAWQWLRQLVKTLGDCGMSSEESDLENDIETVRVKNMVWRQAIECELDIVDRQRLVEWLMSLTKLQVKKLSISNKRFKWMQVAVV